MQPAKKAYDRESLAAAPQQPGWSLTDVFYNTNVRGGGDVALAREFEIGNVPLKFSGTANARVKADVPLDLPLIQYVFATPVLGGQASVAPAGRLWPQRHQHHGHTERHNHPTRYHEIDLD